jgi:hypothetical protein
MTLKYNEIWAHVKLHFKMVENTKYLCGAIISNMFTSFILLKFVFKSLWSKHVSTVYCSATCSLNKFLYRWGNVSYTSGRVARQQSDTLRAYQRLEHFNIYYNWLWWVILGTQIFMTSRKDITNVKLRRKTTGFLKVGGFKGIMDI